MLTLQWIDSLCVYVRASVYASCGLCVWYLFVCVLCVCVDVCVCMHHVCLSEQLQNSKVQPPKVDLGGSTMAVIIWINLKEPMKVDDKQTCQLGGLIYDPACNNPTHASVQQAPFVQVDTYLLILIITQCLLLLLNT